VGHKERRKRFQGRCSRAQGFDPAIFSPSRTIPNFLIFDLCLDDGPFGVILLRIETDARDSVFSRFVDNALRRRITRQHAKHLSCQRGIKSDLAQRSWGAFGQELFQGQREPLTPYYGLEGFPASQMNANLGSGSVCHSGGQLPPVGAHKAPLQVRSPPNAGGLMSGDASKAVPQAVRFASMPATIGTPKGLPLSSRGQGHAFRARRLRIASLRILSTLKGSNGPAPLEWL